MTAPAKLGAAGRLARAFIHSKLTPLIFVASVILGAFAVWRLPREEEPQIVVPMSDVFVRMPGASAKEIEERVTKPLERLLWEIPGVEYLYSTSSPGLATVIVRFKVGEDEERSMVRLTEKLAAHMDIVPPGASAPLVKPRSIDDVPVLALTLWSKRYSGFELRRIAAELMEQVKQVNGVSEVTLTGGERRQVRVQLDPERMAAHHLSPLAIASAVQAANERLPASAMSTANREILLETGTVLASANDVGGVVVGAAGGRASFPSGSTVRAINSSLSTADTTYSPQGVSVLGSGEIVVAGYSRSKSDGAYQSLLATFASNGVQQRFATPRSGELLRAIKVDSSGRIVVGGSSVVSGPTQFLAERYTVGGTGAIALDGVFGNGGVRTIKLGSAYADANAIALDGSGRILLAGSSSSGTGYIMQTARLTPGGAIDTTYTASGTAGFQFTGSSSEAAFAVAVQSDGKVVLGGTAANELGLVRFAP